MSSSSSSSSSSSPKARKTTPKATARGETKMAQANKAWEAYCKKHKQEYIKSWLKHKNEGKEGELVGITLEKVIEMKIETVRFQQAMQAAINPHQSVFSRWMPQ